MSAFGGKADIPLTVAMSAYDRLSAFRLVDVLANCEDDTGHMAIA
jgi:hypothetical protein